MMPSSRAVQLLGATLLATLQIGNSCFAAESERGQRNKVLSADAVNQTGSVDEFSPSSKSLGSSFYGDLDRRKVSASPLSDYCLSLLSSHQNDFRLPFSGYRPSQCISLLATVRTAQAAEPGRLTRGGDGGSGPDGAGGRGGDSGAAGEQRDIDNSLPEAPIVPLRASQGFISYCVSVLKSRGRRLGGGGYTPADCAYYLLSLDRKAAASRDQRPKHPVPAPSQGGPNGPDGVGTYGGVGGLGGKGGSGYGGGAGGAGGAGIGGTGGAGGAGGASR